MTVYLLKKTSNNSFDVSFYSGVERLKNISIGI
jgi:hypothetical protein